MDFAISEKMKTVLGMIDEFVDKELIPLEHEFLSADFREMLPLLEEKRRMVKQMELWGPNHPMEFGGMGLTMVDHGLVSEALGRTPLGHYVFGCQAPDAGNIEILHLHGTKEQKEQYLKPLVAGRHPQLLRHDRGRHRRLEPGDARDDCRQGRRRLRHQRA